VILGRFVVTFVSSLDRQEDENVRFREPLATLGRQQFKLDAHFRVVPPPKLFLSPATLQQAAPPRCAHVGQPESEILSVGRCLLRAAPYTRQEPRLRPTLPRSTLAKNPLAQRDQIPHHQRKRPLFMRLQRAEYRLGVLSKRTFQFA
jgi:hypothetical protein